MQVVGIKKVPMGQQMEITFNQGIKTVVAVVDRKHSGKAVSSVELEVGMTSSRSYKWAVCLCRQHPMPEKAGYISAEYIMICRKPFCLVLQTSSPQP